MDKYQLIGFILLTPFLVYFCVKFGTFGFFKGKDLAKKEKEFRRKNKP